jgi:hypothetical protein
MLGRRIRKGVKLLESSNAAREEATRVEFELDGRAKSVEEAGRKGRVKSLGILATKAVDSGQ